jgi:hypothetical protein
MWFFVMAKASCSLALTNFCHKGKAFSQGINKPFLYSPQKFFQEGSGLRSETIVTAGTIVFVPLVSLL